MRLTFKRFFKLLSVVKLYLFFTETYKYDCISTDLDSVDKKLFSDSLQVITNETSNNQLIVIEPNNTILKKFQNTLKQHLIKLRTNIKEELLTLVSTKTNFSYCF